MRDKAPLEKSLLDLNIDWHTWPITQPPALIDSFDTGLNHKTLLFESGKQHYVLKLFESPSPMAIVAQKWASKLSLSPTILHSPDDGRYLLMEFIDGVSLEGSKLNLDNIKAIADSLAKLHAQSIDQTVIASGFFNYLRFCEHYLQKCDIQIKEQHVELLPALIIFVQDPTPLSYCHNDLVASNCIFYDARAVLLDWEFAQINNPWFDLASIVYYLKLDRSQSLSFLQSYQSGLESEFEQDIYYAARCAVIWIDILWHLDKFGPAYLPELTEKMADLNRANEALRRLLVS